MAELAIEDKLVALGTNVDGGFPAEENESEDIAVLELQLATRDLIFPLPLS